jgi:predicted HAD superfamily phosphohydrolase YqeG
MPNSYTRKKTLLLDMDETLIHSEELDPAKLTQSHPNKYDFNIEIFANNKLNKIGIYTRPFMKEFL